MKKCKRTHQLKRCGDYWTYARTLCGKEMLRKNTTSCIDNTTCPDCIRVILMSQEQSIAKLAQRLSEVEL
jgi:hypothetical protein